MLGFLKKYHVLFLLCTLCQLMLMGSTTLLAQQFPFIRYTVADGLPNSNVWSLMEDSKGFIWMGTANGACRFDGHQFKLISKEEGLLDNNVIHLYSDEKNQIHIASYRKGVTIVKEDGTILAKKEAKGFTPNLDNFAFNDTLYGYNGPRFFYLTPAGKRINVRLDKSDPLPDLPNSPFYIEGLLLSQKKRILMASNNGLWEFKNNQFHSILADSLRGLRLYSFFEEPDGRIWLGGLGQIYLYHPEEKRIENFSYNLPPEDFVSRILKDHQGRLWLSIANKGLYLIENGALRFMGDLLGIGNTNINYFIEDRNHNVWIGTFGKGVVMVPDVPFQNYTEADGLSNELINSLCFDQKNGQLWVGTFNKLNVFKEDQFEVVEVETDARGQHYIRDIKNHFNGDLLVNTWNSKMGDLRHKTAFGRNIYYGDLQSAWGTKRDGSLLVYGLDFQLSHFRKVGNKYKFVEHKYKGAYLNHPRTFYEDKQGLQWFGGNNGLFQLEGDTFLATKDMGTEFPEIVKYGQVNVLSENDSGDFWVGTNDGLAGKVNGVWNSYYKSDGLLDNTIKDLCFDKDGVLWIGTPSGLNVLKNGYFESFTTAEGLVTNEVGALAYDSAGHQLWVGTISGLSRLDLNQFSIEPTKAALPFYITSVSNGDTLILDPKEVIEFDSESNNIQINFVGLEYKNPQAAVYEYRLLSGQKEWKTTQNRQIEFSALASGNYIFEVRPKILDKNADRDTQTVRRLSFKIMPPFWKTVQFYLWASLIAILTIITISYLWVKGVQKEKEEEKKLTARINELEQQASMAMMNPHFIFNALTSIQSYIVRHEAKEASEYLSEFAKLIRANIDLLSKKVVPLSEELDRLKLYLKLEKLRFGEKLSFSIYVGEEVDIDELELPSMILQPFVENAILHGIIPRGRKGHIQISIHVLRDKLLLIEILDDGIGIKTSQALRKKTGAQHVSLGLAITKERINRFANRNQLEEESFIDIRERYLENGEVAGTQVSIRLPLKDD